MPEFRTEQERNAFLDAQYQMAADKEAAQKRAALAEERADRSIRINQRLLLVTIILGVFELTVQVLTNLDAIIRNLTSLLP